MTDAKKLCLLAFSGGLDTSYCVLHLRERGFEVVTASVNTGGFDTAELARIAALSKQLGASAHHVIEAQAQLWQHYLRYLLFGNVLRGQMYPLSVSAKCASMLPFARWCRAWRSSRPCAS
jgi:argininosuccinate synthase